MGLFDYFSGFADDALGAFTADGFGAAAGGFLGGLSSNLSTGIPVSYPIYQPSYPMSGPSATPTAASVPGGAVAAAGAIARYLPRWATSYPSLWQALQKMRATGQGAVTVEKLYSALKRFGPQVLSTMVGAAAVADLISYKTTHKRRRMNPANARALRRSMRRLHSFDRLATRVKSQLGTSCRRRRK